MKSHPSRVRELKLNLRRNKLILQMSHPSRVRELKREAGNDAHNMAIGRTPPGCVN